MSQWQNFLPLPKDPSKSTNFVSPINDNFLFESPKTTGDKHDNTSDPLISKLDNIEITLNQICNQHDALMPFLSLKDQIPGISKMETNLKNLQIKLNEHEEKFKKTDKHFKEYLYSLDLDINKFNNIKQEKFPEFPHFDKNLRSITNHINTLQTNLKEIENKTLNLQKKTEIKFKDEANLVNKEVDKMLETNKNEIQNIIAEFKNKIELSLKKQNEVYKELQSYKKDYDIQTVNPLDKDKLVEDIHNIMSSKIDHYIENVKLVYEKDITDLYKSIGCLRCEMEMIYEQNRKDQIISNLKLMPKDVEISEKKIKINNLEQSLFLNEIENFNKENTIRINNELQTLEEKVFSIQSEFASKNKSKLNLSNSRQEIDFIEDRFLNVKYQIEGAKKKCLFDMKRIEEKMDKLNIIRKQINVEMQKNSKLQKNLPSEIKTIESFPEKIRGQMEEINANLETSCKKLQLVDEKINEAKQYMKKNT